MPLLRTPRLGRWLLAALIGGATLASAPAALAQLPDPSELPVELETEPVPPLPSPPPAPELPVPLPPVPPAPVPLPPAPSPVPLPTPIVTPLPVPLPLPTPLPVPLPLPTPLPVPVPTTAPLPDVPVPLPVPVPDLSPEIPPVNVDPLPVITGLLDGPARINGLPRDPSAPQPITAVTAAPVTAAPPFPAEGTAEPPAAAPSPTGAATAATATGEELVSGRKGFLSVTPLVNVATDASVAEKVARVLGRAAREFRFPILVALAVLAFLVLQGRLDRRDARLARIEVEEEEISFA